MSNKAKEIIEECANQLETHKKNCSGFVKAVANKFGITLEGKADDIVSQIQKKPWGKLKDGVDAKAKADVGFLVIAGLAAKDHVEKTTNGHVVIVVSGDLAKDKYPHAYWGSISATAKPGENDTINFAWKKDNLDKLIYAAVKIE